MTVDEAEKAGRALLAPETAAEVQPETQVTRYMNEVVNRLTDDEVADLATRLGAPVKRRGTFALRISIHDRLLAQMKGQVAT